MSRTTRVRATSSSLKPEWRSKEPFQSGLTGDRVALAAIGEKGLLQQMLEWTAAASGARFRALVQHTDADREWAYDRKSKIGKLDQAWDEATRRGWLVVDMKRDWKVIYPFEK